VSALAAPAAATAAPKPAAQPDRSLYDLEVWEAARLIETRSVTATEIALATLERIAAVESTIDAFVLQYPEDEVLAQAKAADRLLRQGTYLGPLHGIPVGLKDI
jgi:Asp-tRNA(Asn)/Glu-tRNA(Gln) amidotransferase A subunit family amidase